MPMISSQKLRRIELENHPGEWYELKEYLNWAEMERATGSEALVMRQQSLFRERRQRNAEPDMMQITIDPVVLKTAKLEQILSAWSHRLPITAENIAKLDAATVNLLIEHCDEILEQNRGGESLPDPLSLNSNGLSEKPPVVEMQPVKS